MALQKNEANLWDGGRLKRLRQELGISIDTLSKDLEINQGTLKWYESGDVSPNIENVMKLSNYFNVSIDTFLRGENFTDNIKYDAFLKRALKSYKKEHIGEDIMTDDTIIPEYPYNLLCAVFHRGKKGGRIINKDLYSELESYLLKMVQSEKINEGEMAEILKYFGKPFTFDLTKHQIDGLERVISSLTPVEQKVIGLRYRENLTLEEAGKRLGVTRERIRQAEMAALRKIRHPQNVMYIQGE